MARDYEDMSSIDDLSDDELRDLVRDRLSEHPTLDVDEITVQVDNGTVRLEGRVGTEGELRIADHVLTRPSRRTVPSSTCTVISSTSSVACSPSRSRTRARSSSSFRSSMLLVSS